MNTASKKDKTHGKTQRQVMSSGNKPGEKPASSAEKDSKNKEAVEDRKRNRQGDQSGHSSKSQKTEIILNNVEYTFKGIPNSILQSEALKKYIDSARELSLQSGYHASELVNSSDTVKCKLVLYTKLLLKPFRNSPELAIELEEVDEYLQIISDAHRDFNNVSDHKEVSDSFLVQYFKSVIEITDCFYELLATIADTVEYSNAMDSRSMKSEMSGVTANLDDENDDPESTIVTESQEEETSVQTSSPDWGSEPVQKYTVDCDEMTVNTEKYKRESYQMDVRGKQITDSHANTQRNSHLRKLKSEFKNTTASFAIVTYSTESQTSAQMADNAWVSLYMAHGCTEADFSVSDALSPYIAMGSVIDTEKFKQIMARGTIPHYKYLGDQGDTIERGVLHLVDLRVDTEKFVVTGSDVPSYDATRVAFEKTWVRDYPGVTINIRKSRCIMKTCVDGVVREIERDTGAMEVEVTIPYGQNHDFPLGHVIIELEDSTRRSLYITNKAYVGAICRECGGSPRDCRRTVEGQIIWACKMLCFSCKGPLENGHNETECLLKRDEDRKAMSQLRRRHNAWLQDVQTYQSKVTDLRKPLGSRDVVDAGCKERAIKTFAAQHQEVKSYAMAAARIGTSPNIKQYDITGEKLAQARAEYNKKAAEFYNVHNKLMAPGVCTITVPQKNTTVNGTGVSKESIVMVVRKHDLSWRPPAQLHPRKPRPEGNFYRGNTGRVHFKDSSWNKNRQNGSVGASSSK